jgi:hypothetical protein
MKKQFLSLAAILLLSAPMVAQTTTETAAAEFKPSGKFDGKIFADFYSTVGEDPASSAFEVKRAYFGYTYNLAPEWSARVLLDIGEDEKSVGVNRYAFFKNAALFYTKDKIKVGFGLQDTYNMKVQEKVWGHRYVEKSFLDLNKFANTADLGLTGQYNLNDKFSFDLGVYNGEGFKQTQKDNVYRGAIGATASLLDKKLLIRVGDEYEDSGSKIDANGVVTYNYIPLNTMTLFAGYVGTKFSVGAEFNNQTNYKHTDNDDRSGISLFGSYDLNSKFTLFGRYDQLTADNTASAEYSYMIFGAEYKIIKNLRAAVNLNDKDPKEGSSTLYAFFNVEYVF